MRPMCNHYAARSGDCNPCLPLPGERLEFGVHRLSCKERTCPAWNPKRLADARYDALLRAAKKDLAYLSAVAEHQVRA